MQARAMPALFYPIRVGRFCDNGTLTDLLVLVITVLPSYRLKFLQHLSLFIERAPIYKRQRYLVITVLSPSYL